MNGKRSFGQMNPNFNCSEPKDVNMFEEMVRERLRENSLNHTEKMEAITTESCKAVIHAKGRHIATRTAVVTFIS